MNNLYLHIIYLKMCKYTFIYQGLKNIKTKKKKQSLNKEFLKNYYYIKIDFPFWKNLLCNI